MLKPAPFVALLRGINVGKAKRIAMADLRKLVEELGLGNSFGLAYIDSAQQGDERCGFKHALLIPVDAQCEG